VLVIDAESTDATVALAQAAGATPLVRAWNGFVEARRFALTQVRTPWTFMLDADERLGAALQEALTAAQPSEAVAGYTVRRTTYLCGRPIQGAGWGNEVLLRLVRTDQTRVSGAPAAGGSAELHERLRVEGELGALNGTLLHDSYPTLASYWRKLHAYTDIEARGLPPSTLGFARAAVLVPPRAFWLYAWRGAWRDGWRGFVVSCGSALYPALATAKALVRR
jgi:glycosyltransferase involved in cell wall biosynthesis